MNMNTYPELISLVFICLVRRVAHFFSADLGRQLRAYGKKRVRITSRITFSNKEGCGNSGRYGRAYGKKWVRITLRMT